MIKKVHLKSILTVIITISIIITNIISVNALDQGRISSTTGTKLREGAGTTYTSKLTIPHNATVTINTQNVQTSDSSTGCTTGLWHNVTYQEYTGYVCSRYVEIINNSEENGEEIETPTSDMATMTDEQFDAYLNEQGFPESYKVKLKELHKLHPNWVFVGVKTRDTWSNVLKNQNVKGRNVYQSTSSSTQGYLSTEDGYYNWYTDKFTAIEGSTWYQASSQTISYYMDPRNFLNEEGIFMFENLNYYKDYQTSTVIKNILYTDFYKDLIQYYMEAATTYNVSPIYLAALSRQEVGLSAGYATSGTTATYCKEDYTGYYNFYNWGANSGVCDGLAYAKDAKWNSPQKAIVDGASKIVAGYINAGQNTPYFQKFNSSKNATKPYYHQYMANVRGVASSAITTKNSYKNMNIIDLPIVFEIPIYAGIPEKTSLPASGNPNNWLKTLTVNGTSVTNFDSEETTYSVTMPTGTKSITLGATTINANAKIKGTGTIELIENQTIANIIVTAQNGSTKTYTITINKPEEQKPEDNDELEKDEDEAEKENNNENNNNENNENNNNNDNTNDNENEKPIDPIEYPTPSETATNAGYKINNNTYMYNFTLGSTVAGTISKLQAANQYASINITNSSNTPKTSGSLVTGDKITIVSDGISQTYVVIIYGDTNGDSEITTLDLLIVQRHLLKKTTLTNAYLKAADVNKDGSVTTLDLLIIQKHLLKKSNISQS